MLFLDGEKYVLNEEDLAELTAVFPDYMKRNIPIRIELNANVAKKVETNDPRSPFVFTKPRHGMFLVHYFNDDETGEQREIRYSDGAPQITADGRKIFMTKHFNIDSNTVFGQKDKELLWFAWKFSNIFSNGDRKIGTAPFKFHMPEKEAAIHANQEVNKAKAILAVSSLSKDSLLDFAKKTVGVVGNESRDILLSRLVSRINKDVEFQNMIVDQLAPSKTDSVIANLLDKAINLEIVKSNLDGTQTILVNGEKEVTLADIPFEDKEALVEFLSKNKKAGELLKKAMA